MADKNDCFEKKKEILIHSREQLTCETVYILTIAGDLMGKNRKCLGTDKVLTFTTGSSASNSEMDQENESIA